ncbi:MAG: hypothetical protein Q9217_003374 [Psora testacea]
MPLENRKRARDDEEGEIEFPREHKRLQSMPLPFRTSPAVKHTRLFSQAKRHAPKPLFTQTITPADSEEEISPAFGPHAIVSQSETLRSNIGFLQEVGEQLDAVMDMGCPKDPQDTQPFDKDSTMLSPKAFPCSLLPNQVENSVVYDATNEGRLPTPIYGHFQQNLEAKLDSNPEKAQAESPLENDYENHMLARRLPTPISEDEAMVVFDSSLPDQPHNQLRQAARFVTPLPYKVSKRGKPMFSMGFRADCDMCRNQVPGHYNHIFRA